jgi:SAM-dependent methyltransferase
MPTLDWLKKEFHYGYDSGNVLSLFPNDVRRKEERAIGGSYRTIFKKAVLPYINENSKILELGPGKGAWSRAILKYIPKGELTTIDFQDVEKWLGPEKYNGRLKCVKVNSNQYMELPDNYFDFFWSFGVLCHNNQESILEVLKNSYQKLKANSFAVHQYGDWEKLESYGWERGAVPFEFKTKPDNEIWWPRNSQSIMTKLAIEAGWKVVTPDLNIIKRDSIIVLHKA